ncbi:hypothetical protein BV22DRAFT_1108532 [Leucogyrophana mollusca]|uniref:Uncharacterized protein n=1 Tax=Leucogyrophana mollusca TaxID=85980 RepID=A0ACB8AWJ5_9AGAM|nr:hypothetical protein BV22DRAFT_1108532 [Leucogyrophana mollusca]
MTKVICALHNTEVDRFKDDIRLRPGERGVDAGTEALAHCTNWTAARAGQSTADDRVHVFEQTGIFVLACQHGFVECATEMKRSGELSKYGLACVNRLLDVCGKDQAVGHDIGCASRTTIGASSIGAKARNLRFIVAVNTFHGWAHGRRFLFNNYKQALTIISEFSTGLDNFKRDKNLTDEDFVRWKDEELQYLENSAKEPEYNTMAVKYVDELQKLRYAEAMYGSVTTSPFLTYTPAEFTSSGLNSSARQGSKAAEAERASAHRKLALQMNVVDDLERRHGITERWTSSHPEWVKAADYIKRRHFIRAVEELEGLVVQRMFEHSKVNLAGTGCKLRKHISKAIARRSASIQTALEKYNKLAPQQRPPRPVLDYTQVISYTSLGEFDLLKHSRSDILDKPWASSANCQAAAKYFKLVRAQEELVHLNVEIHRLQAWISFDDHALLSAAADLEMHKPLLAAAMRSLHAERSRVNQIHRSWLSRIYALSGYTGLRPCGSAGEGCSDDEDCVNEIPDDDILNDEMNRLEDFISNIAT